MELFKTHDYYIFQQGEHSLWCSRKSGKLEPRSAWDLATADDPHCLGMVHGIIGKLNRFPDADPQLLVIESCSLVGYVWNQQPIFRINKIGLLALGPNDPEITTHPCSKLNHSVAFNQRPEEGSKSKQQEALAKTWGSIKSATKSLKTSAAQRIGMDGSGGSGAGVSAASRKLIDEVEKMFSQSESFYFSPGVDLSRSIQANSDDYASRTPSWKTADTRFFWNHYLLKELIDLKDPMADAWIVPVLHGYVHIDTVLVELDDGGPSVDDFQNRKSLTVALISRRSRHRAGTRYKRRGVDENGHVANYVETEQILLFDQHVISFVQLRGSVPVYWSQPGFKYRPPPQIDRGPEDTKLAFQRHFERELSIYEKQCIVSLVEQGGKEKVVGDAFSEQIIQLNESHLTYVTFDFHEHCRGMRFENVQRLVAGLEDVFQDMKYTWTDSHGIIHRQQSTFRVNCMDCLDRTNVCQTAFGKYMLEVQLGKLGILPPEGSFWPALKSAFNIMWANNGDIISRQYAGTNALKGDFTRTGERRFAGMMKDGMNSANRYYLNRFKDTIKQTAIDVMLGAVQPEEAVSLLYGQSEGAGGGNENDEEAVLQTADRVRQVIDDCRKQWVDEEEIIVGSWGLVDAHPLTGDPTQVDMDVIVLLSREHLYVVSYDDDTDKVMDCKKYPLSCIIKLEVGSEAVSKSPSTGKSGGTMSFLKSPSKRESSPTPSSASFLMRIHLSHGGPLQFRSTRLRFFNNMAVPICKTEDMNESLKAIAENIHVTMEIFGMTIPYVVGTLEKFSKTEKKNNIEIPLAWQGFPRNTSEGQLSAFKQAGNKALSSMTSQLSRLKPISKISLTRSAGKTNKKDDDTVLAEPQIMPGVQVELSSSPPTDFVLLSKDVLYSTEAGVLFVGSCDQPTSSGLVIEPEPQVPMISTPKILSRCLSAGQFNQRHLPLNFGKARKKLQVTPEIMVSSTDGKIDSSNLPRSKPLSRSTECMEPSGSAPQQAAGSYLSLASVESIGGLPRASSETSLGSNQSGSGTLGGSLSEGTMKNSKSEHEPSGFHRAANALSSSFKIGASPQSRFSSILSPKGGNPLGGLLAKGVQNLGHLDPRKMLEPMNIKRESSSTGVATGNQTNNVVKELTIQELNCSTRIIHL